MKNIIILSVILFAGNLRAADDCDLFKEEVAVVSEQVQAMYKEMYEAKEFANTAEERKTESDNQKLGRYLSSIKKELELIEHGMSQLKLHQDCACPEFKFQYVDNTIIEVKYWLKKAQSVDRVKPKKTDYSSITSNLGKSMDKASVLQVYFLNPCHGETVAKTDEKVEEPKPEPVVEAKTDTTSEIKEATQPQETELAAEVPGQVMDTVRHKDASVKTMVESDEIDAKIKEEEPVVEESKNNTTESENDKASNANVSTGSGSGTGAAVAAGAVAVAGTAAILKGTNANDTTNQKKPEETVIAEEKVAPATEQAQPVVNEGANIAGETEALGNTALVAGGTAAAVLVNNEDSNKNLEASKPDTVIATDESLVQETVAEEPKTPTQPEVMVAPTVVMDTVKHTDVSEAAKPTPAEEEPKAPVVQEPISTPKVKVPVVVAAPKAAPTAKSNPVPEYFHYSVQIATGTANTSEAKYSSLGEEVYSVYESGMNKYRVGKYKSLAEARASKNKAFNAGFIDAFIVVYNNGSRISFNEAKNIENGDVAPASNSKKPAKASGGTSGKIKTPKLKRKDDVFLAVQIGANLSTTDPVYELIKYERLIGMEVHVLHGNPMRFYTGKVTTAAEADRLLNTVKNAGVQEAFLIGISNDKRIDYSAALEFLGL